MPHLLNGEIGNLAGALFFLYISAGSLHHRRKGRWSDERKARVDLVIWVDKLNAPRGSEGLHEDVSLPPIYELLIG